MEHEVKELAEKLIDKGAKSVFLYGSRATGDYSENSDWELGAIFEDDKYVERSKLASLALIKVSIYPFKLRELVSGNPDTPFTKSIWLNEIIRTGKTIAGEDIIVQIPPPKITYEDLISDTAFYKARALDAMITFRKSHLDIARDFFVKSSLLGMRDLVLLHGENFPTDYADIIERAAKYLPEEFEDLPKASQNVRQKKAELSLELTFHNIAFFTQVIEPRLRAGNS